MSKIALVAAGLAVGLALAVPIAADASHRGTYNVKYYRCLYSSNYWFKWNNGNYHIQAVTRDNGSWGSWKCTRVQAQIRLYKYVYRGCRSHAEPWGWAVKTSRIRNYVASTSTTVSLKPRGNYISHHQSPDELIGNSYSYC